VGENIAFENALGRLLSIGMPGLESSYGGRLWRAGYIQHGLPKQLLEDALGF
jgi:hypothetical protein